MNTAPRHRSLRAVDSRSLATCTAYGSTEHPRNEMGVKICPTCTPLVYSVLGGAHVGMAS